MAESGGSAKVSAPKPPKIALPPRSSVESLFGGGGFGLSPGPLTLVSNFFDSGSYSFSQLLAGAMASPVAGIAGVKPSFSTDNSADWASKETNRGDLGEGNLGFKQNRPMNLVLGQSPMFMVPPGLSPSVLLNSSGFFSPQSPFGMSHQQALAQVTAQAALSQSYMQMQAEYQSSSLAASAEFASNTTTQQPQQLVETVISESEPESSTMEYSDVSHSDRKSLPSSVAVDKPASDGYNWRKYGQKQVKASDFPRSYYKCTHPSCPVKKKVERNLEGQITEIIYKGQHNHELPQPNKRVKGGGDPNGSINSQVRPELRSQIQTEWSRSNETISSNSVPWRDQISTQLTHVPQSSDQKELVVTEIDDGDDDEPNPKRRNTAVGASEVAVSHKTVAEPRVIVQTRSEVDLLDDGYKWRKYGQKVVKGNPNPRSYYKCTSPGCGVRKHVERSSTDPKAVVTTYEGKHNHDLPAARNSNHVTANSTTMQVKPQRMVAEKPALLDQRPVLLQLKEERVTA